jgi:hypothetical protein
MTAWIEITVEDGISESVLMSLWSHSPKDSHITSVAMSNAHSPVLVRMVLHLSHITNAQGSGGRSAGTCSHSEMQTEYGKLTKRKTHVIAGKTSTDQ